MSCRRFNLRKLRWVLVIYCAIDFLAGSNAGFFPLTQCAAAQFTTVTGTVIDPNSVPYANGTITAKLVISATPTFTTGGFQYAPPTQPVGLSSTGSFVMQLADVTALSPGGGTWSFQVCSAIGSISPALGNGPVCFSVTGIAITGVSQDIGPTLRASALALSLPIGASLPIYLNTGFPGSQTNECNNVTTNSSLSGAVTAVAALRTIVSGVGHDVLCVVTSDAGTPSNIGSLVFPFETSISTTSTGTSGTAGQMLVTGTGNPRISMTNTSTTTRGNVIFWRSCVGGCGTDIRLIEDAAGVGNEDLTWIGSQTSLYMTFNCPAGCATTFANTAGAKQFLIDDGTHDAKVNPEFGIVNGHLAHGTTGSNATDTWGTATCAASTATVTFATAFSNTAYSVLLTDQTTAGGARVSTKNVGSMVITCTGATDSVDYLVMGNPF